MKEEDKELFFKLGLDVQLGLLIFGEARGEPVEGQIAVGCVVRNRTKNGATYPEIITAENQFSCLNSNDPNYGFLMGIVKKIIDGQSPDDPTGIFQQCRWVAQGIVNGSIKDNTGGATNYFNAKIVLPSWASKMKLCKIIGNHTFLKSQ